MNTLLPYANVISNVLIGVSQNDLGRLSVNLPRGITSSLQELRVLY